MKLSQILKPEAIKVIASASSKKRLLQDIGELAQSAYGLDQSLVVEALQERENLGPTGVGHGVALPHARLEGMDQVLGAFIALEKPVDFAAIDRQPVDVIFALFAPENAGVEHLKALALVSRSLRNQALCKKLRSNSDPATLYAILTSDQDMQAA
ncbi:PTS sugar transporter subunit IIA [Pseudooceanicola sp. CBS1P-1]|uniref:PTS transporter subunit EIIA n=1 Tax=Pseudooceanicola albus TaxID=2692189 RepID=A0A6L7G000_9RHOB|nr:MULTISPECIES: PTS sugar transporter subunit IIA [Pseudooceanicola]MBT9383900.1 PTS sugar transporter subunit IIA [Pseudooceanicola endophyticus]MXN16687.1 PTS transporter subunit EIIA [Pseudooceanicola albus]